MATAKPSAAIALIQAVREQLLQPLLDRLPTFPQLKDLAAGPFPSLDNVRALIQLAKAEGIDLEADGVKIYLRSDPAQIDQLVQKVEEMERKGWIWHTVAELRTQVEDLQRRLSGPPSPSPPGTASAASSPLLPDRPTPADPVP